MVINRKMINEMEKAYRKAFTEEFKRYVLVKYGEEPYPHEYSKQDLHEQIRREIRNYDSGNPDIAIKYPSKHWQEEHESLLTLYKEQSLKMYELENYALELEHMLKESGLKTSRMEKQRTEEKIPF